MKKFIVIYHTPAGAAVQTNEMTPEQQAKGMEAWLTWAKNCGDKLVEMGSPLANGQSITPNGISGSTKGVSGYSVLQAENMDAAKALLQGHPHLAWNPAASIEVHETIAIPGM